MADGDYIGVIYRDRERDGKVTLTSSTTGPEGQWLIRDLTDFDVNAWEPSLDTELWRRDGKLHIYVQTTSQGDGEKVIDTPPTPVYVMEVNDL